MSKAEDKSSIRDLLGKKGLHFETVGDLTNEHLLNEQTDLFSSFRASVAEVGLSAVAGISFGVICRP